jgi:alpha-1,3-glucosyltransferase
MTVAPRLGLPINHEALTSVTRGLVGDTSFAVLPEISKEQTFALTFLFQLVSPSYTCSTLDIDNLTGA